MNRGDKDYTKLSIAREKIRIHEKNKTGKDVLVCSDEALDNLYKRKPRYKKELAYIPGLGTEFMEKYGDAFMKVLDEINGRKVDTISLNEKELNILKKYEARLINLNRRNRLLCTLKIKNKYAFDLYEADDRILVPDLLSSKGTTKKIDLVSFTNKQDKVNKDKIRRLRNLIRETSRQEKESGTHDMFIGYPFVEGKNIKEDFIVRAPLMLFPVKIKETYKKIELTLDTTREIQFNSNLFLAFIKFNSLSVDIPEMSVEKLENNICFQIMKFYEQAGLKLDPFMDIFSPFENLTNDMANTKFTDRFTICNNALLGNFPPFSSAIESDIKKLIENQSVTTNVFDLLIDTDAVDVIDTKNSYVENADFNEDDHCYINSLDFSQEGVLSEASKSDRMVIQGPPGTGKSQTITSIITDVVTKGKNVLVVSQKKAALDVIYSRLGELSHHAILLSDLQDKDEFYKQVGKAILAKDASDFSTVTYDSLSNKIQYYLNQSCDIKDSLMNNKMMNQSIDMCDVFEKASGNYFTSDPDKMFERYLKYSRYKDEKLEALDFDKYYELYSTYTRQNNEDVLIEYINNNSKSKWFKAIDKNLSMEQIVLLNTSLLEFKKQYEVVTTSKCLKKFFATKKAKKLFNKKIKPYFINAWSYQDLIKEVDSILEGLPRYRNIALSYSTISTFSKETLAYGKMVYKISQEENILFSEANRRYFDYLVYSFIDNYEKANSYTYSLMKNYRDLVANVNVYDREKQNMGKNKFKDFMNKAHEFNSCYDIKYNEAKHYSDSIKKPLIKKYIDKYEFELFSNIRIWLMTPEVVSETLPLKAGLFDYVIFDEASQLYVEKGIPSIYRGVNVIIAGDNKQLRPSSLGFSKVDEDLDEEEEDLPVSLDEESLLDLSRFKYPQTMLNFHYRSLYSELIDFSNFAFYEGKLNIAPNIVECEEPPIQVLDVENGIWENRTNKEEAIKVVDLIVDILKSRKNNETIGVITFNSSQKDLIVDLLDDRCLEDSELNNLVVQEYSRVDKGEDHSLFIKNIENVQGDERDIIIFSIGYAKDKSGRLIRNYGWLNQSGGENRLNVAITRAKKKIYIVKSLSSNELQVDDLKNQGPKILKKYLQYSEAISSKDKNLAKSILNSLGDKNEIDVPLNKTALDLKETLEKEGIECELNVGVGKYYIDFAIKKDNKFILGVEFDDSFKRFPNVRERVIHRRRFLESKGWTIYRLFGALYWRDKQDIVNKIIEFYKSK